MENLMRYVARFTQTPENDAQRNWSGYFAPFYIDTKEALEFFGFLPEGFDYMDEEEKAEINLDEIAENNSLMRDPHTKAWRPFHHNGLSCWELEATNLADAITEAKERSDISWGGFGQRTIGKVAMVANVSGDLYIFSCDDVGGEE